MYDSYCLRMSLRGSFLKKATTFCRTNTAIVAHHVVILLIGVPLDIVSGHFLPIPCMYTLIIPNLSCMQMYVWRKDLGDFIIGCFMIHDMANPFLHTTHILKLVSVLCSTLLHPSSVHVFMVNTVTRWHVYTSRAHACLRVHRQCIHHNYIVCCAHACMHVHNKQCDMMYTYDKPKG